MPRIPEIEIERIKRETDLAALVRSRGIELKKHGNGHFAGNCPFHDEKEASFIVTPAKGLYHCMGCGEAGNAIQFIEKFDGIGFRHAYEILLEGKAAFSPQPGGQVKRARARRLENPFRPDADDYQLYDQVIDYYHDRLNKTQAAQDYLKRRGLFDEQAIAAFKIGFADRTIGMRLPEKQRADGKAIRERLKKIGIIRDSGHEHFAGSVVVPVRDTCGKISEMYGRKINDNLRKGTAKHLYLPGPHSGIWNEEAAFATGELILCEAALDALTFWVNGFKNVTFTYGNEGFPDYLFDALLTQRVKRVKLAYDADQSGDRAAKRDIERLTSSGIEVFRVKFPRGMDVNEYARKISPAAKSLALAVNSAEWYGGSLESTSRAHARDNIDNKIAANLVATKNKTPATAKPCEDGSIPAESESSAPQRETVSLERQGEYHIMDLGKRQYRVGGLDKNNSLEVLKVAVRIRYEENPSAGLGECLFHLDSFDMTRDGERRRFIERASEETGLEKELIKRDLGKLLLAMEQAQQERLNAAVESRESRTPEMDTDERKQALEFLKSPDLVKRITEVFEKSGLVGEQINSLAAYLACTSRKLDKPLAVIIQSTTAAGKSTLMEAVLAMFPEEERIKYSAMTGQSLYYLGETDLKHRILAIVEEEGAEKASYALKLLQSEGELTIASTGKDPHTGRMETQEYHVEGPVMIFLTTTAIDIDEELQNRCLTLTVDESKEQTERIHELQRKARTLEGLKLKHERQTLLTLMRNAQRLLEPVDVVNPWADQLTFTAMRTRTRRDHEKYLTLIDAIALLRQYQRPRKKESGSTYIEATLEDIELANSLAPELLGRSLDELPPQTRKVYQAVKEIVKERCKNEEIEQRFSLFSRREVRSKLGWSVTQVRIHLERLKDMEYITARYERPGASHQYELLTDMNEPDTTQHIGLIDVSKLRLRQQPDGKNEGVTAGCRGVPRHPQVIAKSSFRDNLTGCCKRTSGTLAVVES